MSYVTLCTVELKHSYIPHDFVSMFNAIEHKLLVASSEKQNKAIKNCNCGKFKLKKITIAGGRKKKGNYRKGKKVKEKYN